jgi:hypothetical protein
MVGVDANSGIQITGSPGHPIENLRLEDIQLISNGGGTREQAERVPDELGKGYPEPSRIGVMPAYGLYARHVKNLELANLRLSFQKEDQRQAIALSDVQGVEIDNLKVKTASGVAPARFEAVTDATIRNSPLLETGNGIMRSETARAGETAPVPPPRRDTNNPETERVAGAAGTRPTSRPNDNPDARPNLPWLK